MSYYLSSAVDKIVRCTACDQKFADVVKLIPDCGNSICGRCHERLLRSVLKSSEYACQACKKWHTMPESGLADNLALVQITQLEPEERALPEKAKRLQTHIDATQRQLDALVRFDSVAEVNTYCGRVRDQILETVEARVAELKRLGQEHLGDLEEYRKELVSALGHQGPHGRSSKRARKNSSSSSSVDCEGGGWRDSLLASELDRLAADFEQFSDEWKQYFTKLSKAFSDADLDAALEEISRYEPRIEQLTQRTKKAAFGGRLMTWKENDRFLFQRDHIGVFIIETSSQLDHNNNHHREIESPPRAAKVARGRGEGEKRPLLSLLSTLSGHSDIVQDLVFLGDGRLASCSTDKSIKVWRPEGEIELELEVVDADPISLAVLMNGWLACGCRDGSIQIWDLAKQEVTRVLRAHTSAVFSQRALPDGNLASISWDNTINIWDPNVVAGNLLVSMAGHDIEWDGLDLGLLSTGHLVTCSNEESQKRDCVVRVWDPKSGDLVTTAPLSVKAISALLVLADDRLVFGLRSGKLRLYDVKSQCELKPLRTALVGKINWMTQLPSGLVAVSTSSGAARISVVDLDNDALVASIETGHLKKIWTLKLSPDGRRLADSSADHTIKIWSLN